jgi:hypothetical protein
MGVYSGLGGQTCPRRQGENQVGKDGYHGKSSRLCALRNTDNLVVSAPGMFQGVMLFMMLKKSIKKAADHVKHLLSPYHHYVCR